MNHDLDIINCGESEFIDYKILWYPKFKFRLYVPSDIAYSNYDIKKQNTYVRHKFSVVKETSYKFVLRDDVYKHNQNVIYSRKKNLNLHYRYLEPGTIVQSYSGNLTGRLYSGIFVFNRSLHKIDRHIWCHLSDNTKVIPSVLHMYIYEMKNYIIESCIKIPDIEPIIDLVPNLNMVM